MIDVSKGAAIVKCYYAAFLLGLISIGLCFDDSWVLIGGLLVMALNSSQAASAAGTNLTQAGSMGGQLRVRSSNVPAFLAVAILSGTAQRETYQLKRGESAGRRATA